MPDPKSHARSGNYLERLARRLPGFRGYLEKDHRRDSDALVRRAVADRLQQAKGPLDEYASTLVEARQIDALGFVERVRGKIDLLIARAHSPLHGQCGVFDLPRVKEESANRVYACDLRLAAEVDQLESSVDELSGPDNDDLAVLTEMIGQLDALDQAWDEREALLRGLE